MEWLPIKTAPELDRIIVCGWQKPHGRVAGYWWWHEDAVYQGKAVDHPDALFWCALNLPAFPPPPVQATEAGTAETGTGSVHEGAVGNADAPKEDL